MKPVYSPEVFDVASMDAAKAIILTPEGIGTDARWAAETPWIVRLITTHIDVGPSSLVLDYGCGVGRIVKAMIDRFGCSGLGVDISPSMRRLANDYVNANRFTTCSPHELATHEIAQVDVAVCIWCLQHAADPYLDISRIRRIIKPGGKLLVINNLTRAVPTKDGRWVDDGIDIKALLYAAFMPIAAGKLPAEIAPQGLPDLTWWRIFQRR